jgi:hypothetical protein
MLLGCSPAGIVDVLFLAFIAGALGWPRIFDRALIGRQETIPLLKAFVDLQCKYRLISEGFPGDRLAWDTKKQGMICLGCKYGSFPLLSSSLLLDLAR